MAGGQELPTDCHRELCGDKVCVGVDGAELACVVIQVLARGVSVCQSSSNCAPT